MTKRRTEEEIKNIVEGLGYSLILQYLTDKSVRRVVISDNVGYKYDIILGELIKNHTPKIIDKRSSFTLHNLSLWIKENDRDFLLCDGNKYVDTYGKLLCKCLVCQEVFDIDANSIISGRGCPYCSGHRVSKSNSFLNLNPSALKDWDYEKNDISPNQITAKSGKSVWWKCSKCGHKWSSSPNDRWKGYGCEKCNFSKGENKIRNFLEIHDFEFISQKKFDKCVNIRRLKFDFYLQKYNLCIEYNGEQHYSPVNFSGKNINKSHEEFDKIKENDLIKIKYCKNNKIRLLIIPYWEFDNIEKILEKTLSEFR